MFEVPLEQKPVELTSASVKLAQDAYPGNNFLSKVDKQINVVCGGIADGFWEGLNDARSNPLRFSGSLIAGAALTIALEGPSYVRRPALVIAGVGGSGFIRQTKDAFVTCWSAMKDTWQFPNHVTDNRATVAHQLGPLAFEMTLMTVAGCAGAKAGQGLLRHGLQPLSPKALKMITPSQAYAMKRFKLDSSGELVLFPDGVARYQPLADGSVFTYAHRALNPTSSIFYKPAKSPARILPTLKVIQSEKTGLFDRWITQSGEGSLVLTERQLSQSRGAKALLKDIPNGSLPIGFGRARIAWLTPDGTVAVLGPVHARAQCPELLQPFKTQVKRDMQLEWFPYAETRNVTMAEMQALKARMENAGWTASDWKPANCGRLANGRVVRLDPENVIRGQQSPWIMDGS